MEITKEEEDKIINFGAFGYKIPKMARLLELDEQIVKKEFDNKKSVFFALYQKGQDMADYVIDLKLFEMARSGDMKALETLEFRKRKN
jgi:hypothetical protein